MPLVAGQPATFTVTNVEPGAETYLAYSTVGTGTVYAGFLDVTLGLANPKQAGPILPAEQAAPPSGTSPSHNGSRLRLLVPGRNTTRRPTWWPPRRSKRGVTGGTSRRWRTLAPYSHSPSAVTAERPTSVRCPGTPTSTSLNRSSPGLSRAPCNHGHFHRLTMMPRESWGRIRGGVGAAAGHSGPGGQNCDIEKGKFRDSPIGSSRRTCSS